MHTVTVNNKLGSKKIKQKGKQLYKCYDCGYFGNEVAYNCVEENKIAPMFSKYDLQCPKCNVSLDNDEHFVMLYRVRDE